MNVNEYLSNWAACYKKDLTENILPFWLKNGLDRKHGGVYTCLDRDGSLMDTTKSVWFQGRFGFIAAYAYNNIEKNPEWLAASKSCIDFIEAHCFDADGRMYFEVMEDGTPLRKRRYVFSEGFAAIAMSEYAIASGDHTYAEKALELFKRIPEHSGHIGAEVSGYVEIAGTFHHNDSGKYRFTHPCGYQRPVADRADRPFHQGIAYLFHAS